MSNGKIVVTEDMMRRGVAEFREWEDHRVDCGDVMSVTHVPALVLARIVRALFGDEAVLDEKALEFVDFPKDSVSGGV